MDRSGIRPVLMRYAAVDIGTNTILLLIAEVDEQRRLTILMDEQAIPRLGKGTDASRMIAPESLERGLVVLRAYQKAIHELQCDEVIVSGTSALRDAKNRDTVCERILREFGWSIRILSGEDEAVLTYRGAVSASQGDGRALVLDIGGGSTEVIEGIGRDVTEQRSLELGAVRLMERFFPNLPPTSEQIRAAREEIRDHLFGSKPLQSGSRVIGVAGTPTTIAAWNLGLATFDRTLIDGHVFTREVVNRFLAEVSPLGLEQIVAIPSIAPARADVILAGALILQEFMECCQIPQVEASTQGLRFGLLLDAVDRRSWSA